MPRTLTLVMGIAGFVVDFANVGNVPGGVHLVDGKSTLTSVGVVLGMLLIAAWATLWLRRRLPIVTAAAGLVVLGVGVGYLLFLVGMVHLAIRYRRHTALLAWLTGALVAGFVVREILTDWGGWWLSNMTTADGARVGDGQSGLAAVVTPIVLAVLALSVAVAVVLLARTRGQVVASRDLAARAHRRADALHDQLVLQAERERIARDVHDALAHRLSVVSLHAGALAATPGADAHTSELARTVREQTHAALEDMRGLVGGLRSPEAHRDGATVRAVPELVEQLRQTGAHLEATVLLEDVASLTAELDGTVYRIAQEALTNAIRHAPGTLVRLHLSASPVEQIRIRVANALPPAAIRSAPRDGGFGLVGIRERAAAAGGTAWIGEHGQEFLVDVSLPWSAYG